MTRPLSPGAAALMFVINRTGWLVIGVGYGFVLPCQRLSESVVSSNNVSRSKAPSFLVPSLRLNGATR